MTRYVLPDLSYDSDALEPHIDAHTLRLHHDAHHRAHVDSANRLTVELEGLRQSGDFHHVRALEQELAFHVSGHVLHSIFWQNLDPEGGGRPVGELEQHINRDFGSFDSFRVQLGHVAMAVHGSGWAALVFDAVARRLTTAHIGGHDEGVPQGSVPLLVMDVWEHAYAAQYGASRATYLDGLWSLWNWADVAERYSLAQRLDLGLEDVAEEALVASGEVLAPDVGH